MTTDEYNVAYFEEATPAEAKRRRRCDNPVECTLREYAHAADAVDFHLRELAYSKAPLDKVKAVVLDALPNLHHQSLANEIISAYEPLDDNIIRFVVRAFAEHAGTDMTRSKRSLLQTRPFVHAMLCLGMHTIANDDDEKDERFTSRRTSVLMCIFTRVRITPELRLALAYAMTNMNKHQWDFLFELDKQALFSEIVAKYPLPPPTEAENNNDAIPLF